MYNFIDFVKENLEKEYNEFCVLIEDVNDFHRLMRILELHNFKYNEKSYHETKHAIINRINENNNYLIFIHIKTGEISFINHRYMIRIDNWYNTEDFKNVYPKFLSLGDKKDFFLINNFLRKSTWSFGPTYKPKSIIKENFIIKWNKFIIT